MLRHILLIAWYYLHWAEQRILVPRGRAPFDQHQESRFLVLTKRSADSGDENAEQRRGLFLHMLRRKMWVTAGMRLLCVYANRKMAVVLTNFSAMFPFVICVKESENQPNGFGGLIESPNQVRFRRSKPKQTL